MVLVTPSVTIIVLLLITIIALMIAAAVNPYHFEKTRIKTFLGAVAGLGIFVTFLFYYSVVGLQQQQQRLSILDATSNIVLTLRTQLLADIKAATATIPQFAYSLLPLLPCGTLYSEGDLCSNRGCVETYDLAARVFALFLAAILSYSFFDVDPISLTATFLQYAHSPFLYQQWELQYINYDTDMRSYTNLLFEYGLPITDQTPQAYEAAAARMVNDPRYKRINFNNR